MKSAVRLKPLGVLLASLLIAHPAVAAADPAAPSLADRVMSYWAARKDFDLSTSWSSEYGMRTGEDNSLAYYQRLQRAPKIIDFKIEEPVTEGQRATVPVSLTVALPFADRSIVKRSQLVDHWVYEDGSWWRKGAEEAPSDKQLPANADASAPQRPRE